MDAYSALVKQVLNVPLLAKHAETLAADQDVLNLITMDWKERLENHKPFQDFQHNARNMFQAEYLSRNHYFRIQQLADGVTPLKVIIAGKGKIITPYEKGITNQNLAVQLNESPVLAMMISAMTNDIDQKRTKVNASCKLNFKNCSMCCQYCNSARECMIAHNIPTIFPYYQPCIVETFMFISFSREDFLQSQISPQRNNRFFPKTAS
ncbi:hypothetical protein AVEN_166291-1 [Araneus ventricosus]|uniref:Uncharacterized protein n=1 Tax=Araneus ventricosus TaxID=182803 RepID=A0A4Y2FSQ0_ARAVE|nr:hypothetical protein AVEN_166291-1 [Araneus ventricosus]